MIAGIAATPTSWGVFSWAVVEPPPWQTTLDQMARAGYRGVELGRRGYFPEDAVELGAALRSRGLEAVAGFVAAPLSDPACSADCAEQAEQVSSLLSSLGARNVVVLDAIGQPDRSRTAGRSAEAGRLEGRRWSTLVSAVQQIGEIANRHGLRATFHPHAGTHVEFEDEIERLLTDTDPSLLALCLDTGHSAYAGIDPVEFYRRHSSRVAYMHLKDVDEGRLQRALADKLSFQEAAQTGVFCRIGTGAIDFSLLYDEIQANEYEGWLTVEQDRFPGTTSSAFDDAEESVRHLREGGLLSGGPVVS